MTIPPGVSLFPAALMTLAGLTLPAIADEDPTPRSSEAIYTEIPGETEFSGRMIVRPRQLDDWIEAGISAPAASGFVAAAHGFARSAEVFEYVPQTDEFIIFVADGETENSTAAVFMDTGLFQYAEPDWFVYPVGVPNDPGFGSQWHHDANRMDSAAGWDIHSGDPAASAVAICDTGIRTSHEDFQLHRLEGYNAVDQKWESQGGDVGPIASHGTLTSGAAAANGNNNKGVIGMGWDLSHRMVRVTNSSGGGAYLSDIQHGARTAVESGDRVASASYSGVDNGSNLTTATYIKSIGGLLIWAAGNDDRNLTYGDRDADDIIVVGATDSSDTKAGFSAYGQFMDLTGPGVGIYTCDSGNDSDYASASGTSLSTPLAAGLAALIWSYNPALTPDEVEAALKDGCQDLGSGGVDNTYGYGRIDVVGSLNSIAPSCPDPTNYCFTSPNSAGSGALMSWIGTTSITADDFYLESSGLPPNQFMMFYYGAGAITNPFGNGFQCVGNGGVGLFRFKPFMADFTGMATMKVDYTVPPAGVGGGIGRWLPGDVWFTQAWYRDPAGGGAQFNLSDGLRVEICP
jgi:hypothetical protein